MTDRVLGVLLAGGANTRYGSHKALADVGGASMLARAVGALSGATREVGIVANDSAPYAGVGLETRPDALPGTGVLGGILTAVLWARELRREAALVLACDMPFVPAALLRELAARAGRARVVVPASPGRRGLEPLCAACGADTAAAIEAALARGDRAVVSFYDDVEVVVLPIDEVRRFGDPERMFWNVNRPEDRDAADRWAREPRGAVDEESRHASS